MVTLPRIEADDPQQALDLCQNLLELVAGITEPLIHLDPGHPATLPAADAQAIHAATRLVQHTLAHVQASASA